MGSKHRLSQMLSQSPITGTDEQIAIVHETNRENVVKQVLLHVFFLSKFKFINGQVTTEAAESQYLTAHGLNQAAHCVPGQVMFNGDSIQSLITNSDDMQLVVENLFGNTDDIHARFNIADSRAEENGLRAALGNACNSASMAGKIARFNRAEEFYHYLDGAYQLYKTQGVAAFNTAINIQRTKMQSGSELTGTTRREVIFILETYRATLSSSLVTLETVQGLFPEDLWREYRSLV